MFRQFLCMLAQHVLWHVQVQTGASLQNSPMPAAELADSPAVEQPMENAQQVRLPLWPSARH